MICGNEVYVGGPPDGNREQCWGTAVTKCVDCQMLLCIACLDSCYEKACDLCPGCLVDHGKKTGHQVEIPNLVAASKFVIDKFTEHVVQILDKERAS
jgi:hypothetical protein